MTETGLIELLRNKDSNAYSLIYDKYAPALYGIICKLVREEKLAQEVLRKTFISIWQQSGRLGKANVGLFIWMHNIARNVAMEEMNRKIRHENVAPEATNFKRISALGLTSIFLS